MPTEIPYWAKSYVTIFVRAAIDWLTFFLANPNLI